MKKTFGRDMYMVIDLGDKALGDDLEGCLKIVCTNKSALSKATGIRYYRLVYVFKRQGRSFLMENGKLIFRSEIMYKGSQPGGFRYLSNRGRVY